MGERKEEKERGIKMQGRDKGGSFHIKKCHFACNYTYIHVEERSKALKLSHLQNNVIQILFLVFSYFSKMKINYF